MHGRSKHGNSKGDGPIEYRKLLQQKRKKVLETVLEKQWKPVIVANVDANAAAKRIYSQEDNFRAYRMFSIMDVDHGGSVSRRELNRVLMGDAYQTATVHSAHPDTGIVWTLDSENCVVVDHVDPDSPLIDDPTLVRGLRLIRINDRKITLHDPNSLKLLYKYMLQLSDEPVEMEFEEPLLILTEFSNVLNIEIENKEHVVTLPVGAVYKIETFEQEVEQIFSQLEDVRWIRMNIDRRTRQVSFKSDEYSFRLLFKSGKDTHLSCRYALGFSAEDTHHHHEHHGLPLVIDLNLGISQKELTILMDELFVKFDAQGTGEFDFESFRNFYITYLDTEESRAELKRYAHFKFRDLEREAWWNAKVEREKQKRIARKELKERNKAVTDQQRLRGVETSVVGPDHITRRVKQRVLDEHKRQWEEAEKKKKKRGYARMAEEAALKAAAIVAAEAAAAAGGDEATVGSLGNQSIPSDWTPSQIEAKRLKDERKAALKARRTAAREKAKSQAAKRKKILWKIREANDKLNKREKRDRKKAHERVKYDYMTTELKEAIRKGTEGSLKIGKTGTDGKVNFELSLKSTIANPAFTMNAAVFGSGTLKPDDIDFNPAPPSALHPAILRYFLIRDPTKRNWEFDSSKRHPVFFTAEYERITLRHSSLGLGCCRVINKQRQEGVDYRKGRGIPTMKPLDPFEDNPKAARKVKAVFINEDCIQTNDGLIARVTVKSISVLSLPSVRLLEPNSPFVTFSCGDNTFSTEINSHAGRDAHWVDLDWCFRVYSGKEIKFSVFSGSILLHSLIGTIQLTTDEFVKLPIAANGEMEILTPIRVPSNKNVGQIRIKFIVELGQLWEWHVFNHMLEVKAADKLAKFKRRLFKKTAGVEPASVAYPIHVELYNLSLFDLHPVHMFAANSPQVHAECGSFVQATSIRDHGGETALWPGLNWKIHMMSERANIIFDVVSGQAKIGRFAISGLNLCRIPRSKTGKFQLNGTLTLNGVNRGNLRAECQLFRGKSGPNWKREDVLFQDDSVDPGDVLQVPFLGNTSSSIVDIKHTPLQGGNSAHAVVVPTGSRGNNTFADEDSLDLPARVTVKQIIAADLTSVHFQSKNSPKVLIKCGYFNNETEVLVHGGASGKWTNLYWQLPLARGMNFEVIVVSTTAGILPGVSAPVNTPIGAASFTAGELAQWTKNRHGDSVVKKHLTNGSDIRGGIQLLLTITKERETSLSRFFPALMDPYLVDMEKTGILVNTFEPVDSNNRSLYPATSMTMEKVKQQTAEAFPFRLNITRVTVTDLRSMHFLHKNSPFVNAACGLWAQSTKPRHNAGKHAEWVGLQWNAFVHEEDSLRMTVWSRDSCIGSAQFLAQELIESPSNSADMSELFKILTLNGSVQGKIRIEFTKESFTKAPVKESKLVHSITIEPPLLATIYQISVFDLRAAHPFSKNFPIVRGQCGIKKWSTQPKREAGDTRWDDVMWDVFFDIGSEFTLTVLSGTVLIGNITVVAEDLTRLPQNIEGLTVFDGYIRTGDRIDDTGRVQIVCRLEAHVESDGEDPDSDDDLMFEFDTKNSMLGLPRQVVPRVSKASLVAVSLHNLVPLHKMVANSPFIIVSCGGWNARTETRKYAGASAKWLDLPWSFQIRRLSVITLLAATSDKVFGVFRISTRDVYDIVPDESGYTLVEGRVVDETGAVNGGVKMVLRIEGLEFHADEDEFSHVEVDGAVYHQYDEPFQLPATLLIDRVFVTGLPPRLHTFSTNCPLVEVRCGALIHRTDPIKGGGVGTIKAEWYELGWKINLRSEGHAFNVTVRSGGVTVGSLSVAVKDILSLPRTSRGYVRIEGNLIDGSKCLGKVCVTAKLNKLRSREEQEDIVNGFGAPDGAEDTTDLEAADAAAAGSAVLGQFLFTSITASDMNQRIGLYRQSPQVYVSMAAEEYMSTVATHAGNTAVWSKLETSWIPAPLFAKKFMNLRVMSGDELIGSIDVASEAILMLPRDPFGTVVIVGELLDGSVVKGNIQIRGKIQPFDGDLLETKQFLKDKVQNNNTNNESTTLKRAAEGSDELSRPLSATTPTPIFTRVCIHEILLTELRPAHVLARNSPVVSLTCGSSFSAKTDVAEAAGAEAKWVNQSFAFTMRKMTYCKISVSSKGIFLGSAVVSTREVLECPKTPNGVTILKRALEKDAEVMGYAHLYLRYGTQGEEIVVQKEGDRYTNPVSSNVAQQASTAHMSLISTDVHAMNFPIRVIVHRLNILDMLAMHNLTPNSPYAFMSCADWKQKTPVAYMSGSSAEWDNLSYSFVLYDDRAIFKVELRSGSVVAGKWSLSIGQIIATPRNKDGRIDIAGYIKQGGSLIARIAVQVIILPFISEEAKASMSMHHPSHPSPLGTSLMDPSVDFEAFAANVAAAQADTKTAPISYGPASVSAVAPMAAAISGNDDDVVGTLNVKVITVMDLSRLIGGIRAIGKVDIWAQTSKMVETIAGMAVVGPLGHAWHGISLKRNSKMCIGIESDQDRQVIGEIAISSLEILHLPADEKGNIMVVGDILRGNSHQGRISLGCEFFPTKPRPGSPNSKMVSTMLEEKQSSSVILGPPITASKDALPSMDGNVHVPSADTFSRPGSPVLNVSYYINQSNNNNREVGSPSPSPSSRSPSPISARSRRGESRIGPGDNIDGNEDDDFKSVITNFTGIINPPIERPCIVKIHAISLFDLPSLHVLLPNSPMVFMTFGEWKSKTSEAHRAGNDAEWSNMNHVSFTVPIDNDDKFPSLTLLVRSGSLIAGSIALNIDELLSKPRMRDGKVVLTEILKGEGGLNRGRIRVEFSFEQLQQAPGGLGFTPRTVGGEAADGGSLSIITASATTKLQPQVLTAKISIRMITLMELDAKASGGSVRATAKNGPTWKGSTQAFPVIAHMTALTDLTWDQVPLYDTAPLQIHFVLEATDRVIGILDVPTKDVLAQSRDQRENLIFSGIVYSPPWELQQYPHQKVSSPSSSQRLQRVVGKATLECRLDWLKSSSRASSPTASRPQTGTRDPSRPVSPISALTRDGGRRESKSMVGDDDEMTAASFMQPSVAPSLLSAAPSLATFDVEAHLPMNLKIYSIKLMDIATRQGIAGFVGFGDSSQLVVYLSCGKWKAKTSSIQQSSGCSVVEWGGLNLNVRIQDARTNVHILVRSNNRVCGTVMLSPKEIMMTPKQRSGAVLVVGTLRNNEDGGGAIVGRVQLEVGMEKVTHFDTSAAQASLRMMGDNSTKYGLGDSISVFDETATYTKQQTVDEGLLSPSKPSLQELSAMQSRLVKVREVLPLRCKVLSIQVFDVPSLHLLQRNALVVYCSCEEWKANTVAPTEVGAESGSHSEWSKLNWLFNMRTAASHLHVLVRSRTSIAGAVTLSIADLFAVPIQANGVSAVEALIRNDGALAGRLRMDMVLGAERIQAMIDASTVAHQRAVAAAAETEKLKATSGSQQQTSGDNISLAESAMSPQQQLAESSPVKSSRSGAGFGFGSSMSLSQKSLASRGSTTNMAELSHLFPLRPCIFSIQLFDVPPLHSMVENSLVVFLSCGDSWKTKTSIAEVSGSNAEWFGLELPFQMPDAHTPLHVIVRSGAVIAGSWSLTAKELISAPRMTSGKCLMNGYLRSDGCVRGRIQLELDVGIENLEFLANANLNQQSVESTNVDAAELPLQDQETANEFADSNSNNGSKSSSRPSTGSTPLSRARSRADSGGGSDGGDDECILFLVDIVVTDIKNTNNTTARKTLPTVKIDCGDLKFQCKANAINGNSATWTDIMQSMAVRGKSTLRVSLFAGTTLLGADSFRGKLLLESVLDSNGVLHISRELVKQGEATALIAFSFRVAEPGERGRDDIEGMSVDTGADSWAASNSNRSYSTGSGSYSGPSMMTPEEENLERATAISPVDYLQQQLQQGRDDAHGGGGRRGNNRTKRPISSESDRPKSSRGAVDLADDEDDVRHHRGTRDVKRHRPDRDHQESGLEPTGGSGGGSLGSGDMDSNGYFRSRGGSSDTNDNSATASSGSFDSKGYLQFTDKSSSNDDSRTKSLLPPHPQNARPGDFEMGNRQVSDTSMLTVDSGEGRGFDNAVGDDDDRTAASYVSGSTGQASSMGTSRIDQDGYMRDRSLSNSGDSRGTRSNDSSTVFNRDGYIVDDDGTVMSRPTRGNSIAEEDEFEDENRDYYGEDEISSRTAETGSYSDANSGSGTTGGRSTSTRSRRRRSSDTGYSASQTSQASQASGSGSYTSATSSGSSNNAGYLNDEGSHLSEEQRTHNHNKPPLKKDAQGKYVETDQEAVLRLLTQQSVESNSSDRGDRHDVKVSSRKLLTPNGRNRRNVVSADGYVEDDLVSGDSGSGISVDDDYIDNDVDDAETLNSARSSNYSDTDETFREGDDDNSAITHGSSTSNVSATTATSTTTGSGSSYSLYSAASGAEYSTTGYSHGSHISTARASVAEYSTTGYLRNNQTNNNNAPESLMSTPTLTPSSSFSSSHSKTRSSNVDVFSDLMSSSNVDDDYDDGQDGSTTYRSDGSDWTSSNSTSTNRGSSRSSSRVSSARSDASSRSSRSSDQGEESDKDEAVSSMPQPASQVALTTNVTKKVDVNAEITAMTLQRLRSTLSLSHVMVYDPLPQLIGTTTTSATMGMIGSVARSLAIASVSNWLADSIESFVAMESGASFLRDSRVQGDPTDAGGVAVGDLDLLFDVDPSCYVPFLVMAKVFAVAVTRAISQGLEEAGSDREEEEGEYDDNDEELDAIDAVVKQQQNVGDDATAASSVQTSNTGAPNENEPEATTATDIDPPLPTYSQRFKKRQGITLQAVSNLVVVPEKEPEMELEEGEVSEDYFFKVDGFPPVPIKAKITMLDILGMDISGIDHRIFPRRPYLTVCKPYGNWAGRTKEVFVSDKEGRLLTKDDMIFNWYNLSETEGWESYAMRVGQVLVFDLHDGASGLIIAKGKIQYEAILSKKRDGDDRIAFTVPMTIANEYGGGSFMALVRVFIDLSIMKYVRPPKPVEHWEKHRIHHWKTYPLSPICTGVVRKTFGTIALEYDRQKIIHPSLFGFQIHWKGHQTDESRFIHPVFKGYGLSKKPMSKEQAEENVRSLTYTIDPNPYRWDPEAAAQGKCPVCADGLPGCPRCYMLPLTASGQVGTPAAFAFDYDEMMAEAREKMQRQIKEKAAKSRKMKVEELYEEGNKDAMKEKTKVQIHTNLTTYKSLSMYREYIMNLMAVYVKIMPTGGIRKLFVDPTDTVFNLYNMVMSHIGMGNTRTRMLVLPTSVGLFEMTNSSAGADEFSMADTSGQDKLELYGFRKKRGIIILLYFARYYPFAVNTFVQSFITKNSTLKVAEQLPVYDNALSRVPQDLLHDPMQSTLRSIVTRQFAQQQVDLKNKFKQAGLDYKLSKRRQIAQAIEASRGKRDELEKERRAFERRIKSQVRHIPLERRGDAIRILLEREFKKKGFITDEEKALMAKTEEYYKEKVERRNKMIKESEEKGEPVVFNDDDSSVVSLSGIELDGEGEDANGDDEEDGDDGEQRRPRTKESLMDSEYDDKEDIIDDSDADLFDDDGEEDGEGEFDSSEFDDEEEDDEEDEDVEEEDEGEEEEDESAVDGEPSKESEDYDTTFQSINDLSSSGSDPSRGRSRSRSRTRSRLDSALSHSSRSSDDYSDYSDANESRASSRSSSPASTSSTYYDDDDDYDEDANRRRRSSRATSASSYYNTSSSRSGSASASASGSSTYISSRSSSRSSSRASSASGGSRSSESHYGDEYDEADEEAGEAFVESKERGWSGRAQQFRADKFENKDVIIRYVPGDSGSLYASGSGSHSRTPTTTTISADKLTFMGYDSRVDYGAETPVSFASTPRSNYSGRSSITSAPGVFNNNINNNAAPAIATPQRQQPRSRPATGQSAISDISHDSGDGEYLDEDDVGGGVSAHGSVYDDYGESQPGTARSANSSRQRHVEDQGYGGGKLAVAPATTAAVAALGSEAVDVKATGAEQAQLVLPPIQQPPQSQHRQPSATKSHTQTPASTRPSTGASTGAHSQYSYDSRYDDESSPRSAYSSRSRTNSSRSYYSDDRSSAYSDDYSNESTPRRRRGRGGSGRRRGDRGQRRHYDDDYDMDADEGDLVLDPNDELLAGHIPRQMQMSAGEEGGGIGGVGLEGSQVTKESSTYFGFSGFLSDVSGHTTPRFEDDNAQPLTRQQQQEALPAAAEAQAVNSRRSSRRSSHASAAAGAGAATSSRRGSNKSNREEGDVIIADATPNAEEKLKSDLIQDIDNDKDKEVKSRVSSAKSHRSDKSHKSDRSDRSSHHSKRSSAGAGVATGGGDTGIDGGGGGSGQGQMTGTVSLPDIHAKPSLGASSSVGGSAAPVAGTGSNKGGSTGGGGLGSRLGKFFNSSSATALPPATTDPLAAAGAASPDASAPAPAPSAAPTGGGGGLTSRFKLSLGNR